jgi:hypothetical protein
MRAIRIDNFPGTAVLKQLVTIIGLILLFVVVCPITPTPIAVIGGNAQVQMPAVAVASIVFTTSPRLDRPTWRVSSDPVPLLFPTDVLDLTCVCLC